VSEVSIVEDGRGAGCATITTSAEVVVFVGVVVQRKPRCGLDETVTAEYPSGFADAYSAATVANTREPTNINY